MNPCQAGHGKFMKTRAEKAGGICEEKREKSWSEFLRRYFV